MWLPPAYRRPHSATYWKVAGIVAAVAALVLGVAALASDRPFQLVFVGVLGLISLWCWGALRAQNPRGLDHRRNSS